MAINPGNQLEFGYTGTGSGAGSKGGESSGGGAGDIAGKATAALPVIGNYINAFSRDYNKDLAPAGKDEYGYVDTNALRDQVYERDGFSVGDIAQGAAAGAQIAGPWGAVAGAIVGTGSALAKNSRDAEAEVDFTRRKYLGIASAEQQNASTNMRRRRMKHLLASRNNQIKNFYG